MQNTAYRTDALRRPLIHSSSRTAVSTNAVQDRPDRVHIAVHITRLQIWLMDGDVEMRFSASCAESVEPADRRVVKLIRRGMR